MLSQPRQLTVRVRLKPLLIAASLLIIVALSLFIAQLTFMSPQPKAATEKEWLEWAATAWKYFQPNVGVNANTGLDYGASEWHRLTDWDLATYIEAILAAEKLGILQREGVWGSDSRIEKILVFLEKRPITDKKLPYGQYDAETGKVPEDMKKSSVHPSDWGRLLLAVDDLRHARPDLEKRIGAVVTRYNSKLLAEGGYFASPDIYPFYVAQGYWAFGYATPKLADLAMLGNRTTIDVYALSLPKARITSDPLLLAILEDRTSQIYRTYADRMYEAQKRRYEQTGTLTAYGEGSYPNPPYYAYEWIVTADGQQWVIQGQKGPEMLYTKITFAMHAIYSDDYTTILIQKVSSELSENGFYEGVASDGSILQVLTDKTNSMILEAAAYALQRVQGSRLVAGDSFSEGITGTATRTPTPADMERRYPDPTWQSLSALMFTYEEEPLLCDWLSPRLKSGDSCFHSDHLLGGQQVLRFHPHPSRCRSIGQTIGLTACSP